MMMMQAWAEPTPRSYTKVWNAGHWVIAIGYDAEGIYFEEPSLYASRGFIAYRKLTQRWHDVEGEGLKHVQQYGLALWRDEVSLTGFGRAARYLD